MRSATRRLCQSDVFSRPMVHIVEGVARRRELGFSEECLFSNNRFIDRVNNTLVTVNNYGPETGLLRNVELCLKFPSFRRGFQGLHAAV